MAKTISKENMDLILSMQQSELTESVNYEMIAKFVEEIETKKI